MPKRKLELHLRDTSETRKKGRNGTIWLGMALEVPPEKVDLQVDAVEAGEMVAGIMEEVVVIHLMRKMITDQNTEISVDSGCTT